MRLTLTTVPVIPVIMASAKMASTATIVSASLALLVYRQLKAHIADGKNNPFTLIILINSFLLNKVRNAMWK